MYGLLALAALLLAGVSEGTRLSLHDVLNDHPVARTASEGGLKNLRVEPDSVLLRPRNGTPVKIDDPVLARELKDYAEANNLRKMAKRTGVSQVRNVFSARQAACDTVVCGNGPDATCESQTNCNCFKDCGPEGEECFSSCLG